GGKGYLKKWAEIEYRLTVQGCVVPKNRINSIIGLNNRKEKMKISPVISFDEFLKIYTHSNVMIFDVSNGKDASVNYRNEHIAGALFVDLDLQLADIQKDYSMGGRHPLPKIEEFAKILQDMGISKDSYVIIYDDKNSANAASRFWWMLKSVGH